MVVFKHSPEGKDQHSNGTVKFFIILLIYIVIGKIIIIIFQCTVKSRFTNLIRSCRSFVNRHVRKPKTIFPIGINVRVKSINPFLEPR
jgi:hypothetical protein